MSVKKNVIFFALMVKSAFFWAIFFSLKTQKAKKNDLICILCIKAMGKKIKQVNMTL